MLSGPTNPPDTIALLLTYRVDPQFPAQGLQHRQWLCRSQCTGRIDRSAAASCPSHSVRARTSRPHRLDIASPPPRSARGAWRAGRAHRLTLQLSARRLACRAEGGEEAGGPPAISKPTPCDRPPPRTAPPDAAGRSQARGRHRLRPRSPQARPHRKIQQRLPTRVPPRLHRLSQLHAGGR